MFELSATFDLTFATSTPVRFDDLVEQHKQMVLRTAWRMLGSTPDAEDVAQEVFLRLHAEGGAPAAAWIYRVTVNLCLDQIRKRKPVADVAELDVLQASGRNPEEALDLKEKQARLARLIARLPDRERACVVLRDLEGLNSREVALILDCSEETVRTSIFRAKEKLRQWMS
jgi:RNA polymerase sigma-70 factor (ECF subfamily)